MTDRELRHLSRAELVDIIYELQLQSDEKDRQMQKLRSALEDRTLRISKAGSIAEAAISINGVFEVAQAAANQYLASVKTGTAYVERMLAEAEEKRREILSDAEQRAADIVRNAEQQAASLRAGAEGQYAEKSPAFGHRANERISADEEIQKPGAGGSGV